MKKLLSLLLVVLMAFGLVACGDSDNQGVNNPTGEPAKGGTYIVQVDGEPASLNPDYISDDFNYQMSQNIFSRLYKLNNDYQAIPDLATSYDVSDDALTITFHLRENVKWHDGEAFSADDVVYTYKEIKEKNYAQASVFQYVTDITAPDANTVVFTFSQPDGSFVSNVAWYGCFVMPKHLYAGTDWATNPVNDVPVGTGPFKFSAWNKGTDIRIVRNDEYFGDVAYLDEVIFTVIPDAATAYQAWINGEADETFATAMIQTNYEYLKSEGDKYKWANQLWPSVYYLAFNLTSGHFADAKVREAVGWAINNEEVTNKASNGIFAVQEYYIPGLFESYCNGDAKQPGYDVAKAQQLLEDAGYTKNADGYYFDVTFTNMSGFDDYVTVVCDQLDKAGIKCTIDTLDYNIWLDKCQDKYEFEITMLGGFQGPDVLGTGRRWTSTGSVNIERYANPAVDQLFQDALAASSDEELVTIMKEIQTYLAEDVPMYTICAYVTTEPVLSYIHGHPSLHVAEDGSIEKAGFSELTYVWLSK